MTMARRGNIFAGYSTGPINPRLPRRRKPVGNIMAGYSLSPAQQGSSFNSGFRPVAPPSSPASPPGSPPGAAAATVAQFTPDAQYLAEAAQRTFGRNQQLAGYNTQSSQDRQDTAEAIRRMLEQRGLDLQSTRQNANKQGLFYSGQLGKRLGQVNEAYQRQQDDATLAENRREAARQAARDAIMQGAPIEEAAALAESVGRQIDRDSQAAQANALTLNQHATQVQVAQARAKPTQAPAPAKPKPRKPRRPSSRGNIMAGYSRSPVNRRR